MSTVIGFFIHIIMMHREYKGSFKCPSPRISLLTFIIVILIIKSKIFLLGVSIKSLQ